MANTPVVFDAPSGMNLTLELYAWGSDTIANPGGDVATERVNNKGTYEAIVAESLTGWYHATIKDGDGNLIAKYMVYLTDTTSAHRCTERGPDDPSEDWRDGARLDAELDAIKAKTDTLGSGTVVVNAPLSTDGQTLTLVVGDDYYEADGRAIEFRPSTDGDWPDLTGAQVVLTVSTDYGQVLLSVAGTVVNPTTNKLVRFELSSTDTNNLRHGANKFAVEATLANGHNVTLVAQGKCIVLPDY